MVGRMGRRMSVFFRRRVEATIEHMIGMLDEMDGDADFEPETIEEQHDSELDPAERGIHDRHLWHLQEAERIESSTARAANASPPA